MIAARTTPAAVGSTARSGSRATPAGGLPARARARRGAAIRAVDTEATTQATEEAAPVPKVDFRPNTQAASGYVEFDTAGQENMYPVITRAFEVGSDADTLDTGSANLVVGGGAAAIALGVLALGLTALSQQGVVSEPLETYKPLSEYAAAFAAELQ